MNHKQYLNSGPTTITRRQMLKGMCSAAALAACPLFSIGNPSGHKLRVVQVGVGGRGAVNLKALLNLSNVEMVGIADVDRQRLATASQLCPDVKTYIDYRDMFDQLGRKFDAVLVSTPDHMHAPIVTEAMKMGKHVYSEKPLGHSVQENRELRLLAEQTGVTTQLGIQLASTIGQRMTADYIQRGVIGRVREVHVWSFKSWGLDATEYLNPVVPAPDYLDWDLWLGVAQERAFREKTFHPGQWRRCLDFGTGTLGDMGVHIFDTPFRALALEAPLSVKSECREPNSLFHPRKVVTEYQFRPTRYTANTLKWVWYDGKNAPPVIDGFSLGEGQQMPDQGCVYIGEKGGLMMPHMSGPRSFPSELMRSIPRIKYEPIRSHHGEWVNACLGIGETRSPFAYGGPLCEALQVGVVANQFPGQRLDWDHDDLRVTNISDANQYLRREYRKF